MKNSKAPYIGHGGMLGYMPMNTIEALYTCILLDIRAVECDVRLTSDGIPVLMHDSDVSTTTNGTGLVEELTLAQIKELDILNTSTKYNYPIKIPTLEEFLIICKEYDVSPIIDLKTEDSSTKVQENVDVVMKLLKKYGIQKKSAFIAFNASTLKYAKTLDEDICIMLAGNAESPITESTLNDLSSYNNVGVELKSEWTSLYNTETIKKLHDMGMYAYSITYTENAYNAAKSLGVDFYLSNCRYEYDNITEKKFSVTVTKIDSENIAEIKEKESFISGNWELIYESTVPWRLYIYSDKISLYWLNKFGTYINYEFSDSQGARYILTPYKVDRIWHMTWYNNESENAQNIENIPNGENIDVTITFFGNN